MSIPLHLVESAAHEGAFGHNPLPEPSAAQCRAGNYRVGQVSLYGMNIAIEQPRGSARNGVDTKTGKAWSTRLAAHYGYIRGTTGADGDCVDCFIGPYPDSGLAWVINQNVDGKFDEVKVMLAFPDMESARNAYLHSYERGWDGLESIVPVSIPHLKEWLKEGDTTQALRPCLLPGKKGTEIMKVYWNEEALPYGQTLDRVLYDIRRADGKERLLLDAVTAQEILEDADSVIAFDALVTPYNKLNRRMELLRIVLERTGDKIKPVAFQITDPFKQRGVAQVAVIFELSDGQTLTIFFHNPDTTPKKIAPSDELISWKWLLNKKDITIVVAPERGADLNIRDVARRILRLAEKNSAAFARANTKRSERIENIAALKREIVTLEGDLKKAESELEIAKLNAEERNKKRAKKKSKAVAEPKVKENAVPLIKEEAKLKEMAEKSGLPAEPVKEKSEFPLGRTEKDDSYEFYGWRVKVDPGMGPTWIGTVMSSYKHGALFEIKKGEDLTIRVRGENIVSAEPPKQQSQADEPVKKHAPVNVPPLDEELAKIAAVDDAYRFAHASDNFKVRMFESLLKTEYSQFVTAKIMDEAARQYGAEIEWGEFLGGFVGRIKNDGQVLGRVDIGDDGKAMIFVGNAGEERVKSMDGRPFMYSDDDAVRMVKALLRAWQTDAAEPDISYIKGDDELFTLFVPNTPKGEEAWSIINSTPGAEGGKVFSAHVESTIEQLREAGYTVAEDTSTTMTPEELSKELGDEPAPTLRTWQTDAENDPAGGAAVIEAWDAAKADALLAKKKEDQAAESPEFIARKFIEDHLQGRVVKTKIGECAINAASRGKLPLAANRKGSLKLETIARVPEILIDGEVGEKRGNYKERRDGIDGFFPFTHTVDVTGQNGEARVKALLLVGHRETAPNLVYDLKTENAAVLDSAQIEEGFTLTRDFLCVSTQVQDGEPSGRLGYEKSLDTNIDSPDPEVNTILDAASDDDGLNIRILAVWDKDGNLIPELADGYEEPAPESVPAPEPESEQPPTESPGTAPPIDTGIDSFISIAADSLEKLRKEDVYRVLSEAPTRERTGLAAYIIAGRQDLREEVNESLAEILKSSPNPSDAQTFADHTLFLSVIDGTVATADGEGILSPELATSLEAAFYRHTDDAEMVALFEQAVNAYTEAMLAATADLK